MAWTVTKEARAVSFSNWLAHEAPGPQAEAAVPDFYRPQVPSRLKRPDSRESDPFAQSPAVEMGKGKTGLFLG